VAKSELPKYLPEELGEIQYTQTGDVLVLAHPNHPPVVCIRRFDELNDYYAFASAGWSVFPINNAAMGARSVPYLDKNVTATTITSSSSGGTPTLTASADLFDPGHVGA